MNGTRKLRELVRQRVTEQGHGAQTALARAAGISEAGLRAFLVKDGSPTLENAEKLASALGASLPDILADRCDESAWDGPSELSLLPHLDEFTPIPRYDAALSAGPGSIVDPNAPPLGHYYFETQWLSALTRAAGDQLAVVRVDGDSMEPTLADGDWVLIDRTQRKVNRSGVYALSVDDAAWIKRISLNLADKRVQVISDNERYPMQELPEDDLNIIGRAVWIVGRKV